MNYDITVRESSGLRETIYGFPSAVNHDFFQITICGISYCNETYRIDRKNSPVSTLEYILDGEGSICLPDGTVFHPTKGDVYFLHQGENHLYYSDAENPWIKIWFNVSGSYVAQMTQMYHLEHQHWFQNCCIETEMRNFLSNATDPNLNQTQIWDENELVFHRILQRLSASLQDQTPLPDGARRVREWIDRHVSEFPTLQQLTELASISRSQLNRQFKAAYQTTPYEYLLDRKIAMAKEMLLNTGMTVREICFSLGFSDEHYFSSFFKKRTGLSPRSFRQGTRQE